VKTTDGESPDSLIRDGIIPNQYEITMSLEEFQENFAHAAYGRGIKDSQEKNICVVCGGEASDFRDEVSKKEFSISGMCQECQDFTFGPPPE